ncbi:TPA: hypothetical protein DCQ22_03955 [Candidatus Nomurabacteria bacterium]|nr:hypothetical protein [Candidatus Nomurabacteria bacterium]
MEDTNLNDNVRAGFAVSIALVVPIVLGAIVISNAIQQVIAKKKIDLFVQNHITVVDGICYVNSKEESTEK